MTSLYLGVVTSHTGQYEIHAITKDQPFREFGEREIADKSLYQKMLEGRFKVLEGGNPIYCTAIHPNFHTKIEENPHDDREGTVHIVAIDGGGNVMASVSVAVYTQEKMDGTQIGLPLENEFKPGDYAVGASLDPFREKYLRRMYHRNSDVPPWMMAELYRHYKLTQRGDIAPRLGVYTGWYHLGVREARKKGKLPTTLWVFDAIPEYFYLYKLIGKAVLRDWTIDAPPRLVSPQPRQIKFSEIDGEEVILWNGEKISRSLKVLIPMAGGTKFAYRYEDVPFLDGLVDIEYLENDLRKNNFLTDYEGRVGFSLKEKTRIRMGQSIVGKRVFDEVYGPRNLVNGIIYKAALRTTGILRWNFNGIG